MSKRSFVAIVCFAMLSVVAPPLTAEQDIEGSKDHPLFTRMPNFHISEYEDKEFDSHEFEVSRDKNQSVEGHKVVINYRLNEGADPPSVLQVIRNFENAIKKVGGGVLHTSTYYAYLKVEEQGKEVWVEVHVSGNAYDHQLTIVEREAMKQYVVANADAWLSDISATGHVAVYGIHFDTDKADIKPESGPAIQEMAKLLKNNPALKLYVVGHTDGTGEFAHNMKLSEARAAAVVNALVTKHGIAPARLQASGVGPLVPVGSNETEEGRTQNRRVELVKR